MEHFKVIKETIEEHLTDFRNHSVVDIGDLVHLICGFVGDYDIVKNMELQKKSFENVIQNTTYDWVRNISLKNITKLETKQERFFGVRSPPGTPSSTCSGEQCSYYGVEINVCKIQDSPTETPTSERKFGSPTATPSSSDDF